MDQRWYKETDAYRQTTKIHRLWIDLSIAMNHIQSGESILQRRHEPWNSEDPEIKTAWEALTAPENLEMLYEWNADDMNPTARTATAKAIEHCLRRMKEQN